MTVVYFKYTVGSMQLTMFLKRAHLSSETMTTFWVHKLI